MALYSDELHGLRHVRGESAAGDGTITDLSRKIRAVDTPPTLTLTDAAARDEPVDNVKEVA